MGFDPVLELRISSGRFLDIPEDWLSGHVWASQSVLTGRQILATLVSQMALLQLCLPRLSIQHTSTLILLLSPVNVKLDALSVMIKWSHFNIRPSLEEFTPTMK